MSDILSDEEVRVLGALLEKQVTTPDQYPLTLKALQSACNQKSSRDPVMRLDERRVGELIAALERKYLISKRTEYGSRAEKHRQRWCNTEFGKLQFSPGERAVICVLMLRGAQTPGELRSRCQRLHEFASVDEVETALGELGNRDPALVVRLEREPGRRESRFVHCLSGMPEPGKSVAPPTAARTAPAPAPAARDDLERRIEMLEQQVARLQARLEPEG